nr:hypothetical protein [Tanacetum cinerariifolium]
MVYRPKEKSNNVDVDPKQNIWRFDKGNLENLKRSANKFVVLQDNENESVWNDPSFDQRKWNESDVEEDVIEVNDMATSNLVADEINGKARVSWKNVCKDKENGEIGLRSLKEWNETLLVRKLWKFIEGKLMTQDRIKIWNKDDDLKCFLCKNVSDSHKHLFYECVYSAKVRKEMCLMTKLDIDYESMDEVIKYLEDHACKNNIWSVLNRLILAAVTYYLLQERNGKIFRQENRNEKELCSIINDNFKYKPMSLQLKRSNVVMNVAEAWGFKWSNMQLKL